MNRLKVALSILVAALALSACGEREETATGPAQPQKLNLILDYLPNADHAGIYAAQASGEFEKAGIELSITTPSDPAAPVKLLSAGRADLAISYEPELLLARDQGLKIVSIAALVQKPLTSVIALEGSGVGSIADLSGKTVGTAGIPYQDAYLDTLLKAANVDPDSVKRVNVGFNLTPAMLSGKVDATLGAFWNVEGVELQRRKRNPTIIRVEKAGLPTYNELVIVAREQFIRERGPLVRRFLQALARGQEAVRRDPKAAATTLAKSNRDLKRATVEAQIRATLPVFFPSDDDLPFGFQDIREWAKFGAYMLEQKQITRPADPTSLTNEFLPGQGI
jgi:putative hydroxymethylpyrimidine transport system substrate-binding protein